MKAEHKNKESTSGYPHDKVYNIFDMNARMKDIKSGKWFDAVIYENNNEYFVRDKKDFINKFNITE